MSDFDDDSDFDSEGATTDDDLEDLVVLNEPRIKNSNYLEETVPTYNNELFFEHFRVSSEVAQNVSLMYQQSQYFSNKAGMFGKIPPFHQVLIYLWYIGHQTSSFRDVSDRFDITLSSLSRILKRMTLFISNLSPQIIKWPTEEEKQISEEAFRERGFPNIIGSIDGSHIQIDKPETDPDSYINRKGYHSIQLQAVCDHRRKIIDVFVGYPGSVHDSRVFRNSPIGTNLREKCGRYFLLGDSGYPLKPNLLTPYKDRGNLTRQQQNYNIVLARNRYIIEHCFGILKQKFRSLYHIKLRNIRFIVHFIRAACVLHNIALDDEINLDGNNANVPPPPPMLLEEGDIENEDDPDAAAIRNNISLNLPLN